MFYATRDPETQHDWRPTHAPLPDDVIEAEREYERLTRLHDEAIDDFLDSAHLPDDQLEVKRLAMHQAGDRATEAYHRLLEVRGAHLQAAPAPDKIDKPVEAFAG